MMSMSESQLKQFRDKIIQQLEEAKKQKLFWIRKMIALEGSLATCSHILGPSGKQSKPPAKDENEI